ncbi:lambda family phage tail tape measure protein [Alcanivorax xiamenensis]|uniref:Lambda family phage tail tape measure protein n=2 Tax=Alcanivorax xiamenensis TaxID=1177156 RepID=A0ABQ6Y6U2_9GAMM|nr:lambda family phage tail tape measure protein [Alcanivorax xiamenensis]
MGGFKKGMDQADRETKKFSDNTRKRNKEMESGFARLTESVGRTRLAIAAIAGVSATVFAAVAKNTLDAANEVARFSQVSNAGFEEFQRYAEGGRLLGIQQDKLADIFKDTTDKIGDYLETGGGAMADFFDNIASRAGVSAEQFRNLSGPQALELYVKTLEEANVGQNQMTFYMEAIASDATMLLPLLRNNAEGFRLLGERAEQVGAVMDEGILSAAQELQVALFLMNQNVRGVQTEIARNLAPTIIKLNGLFTDLADSTNLATITGKGFSVVLKVVSTAGITMVNVFQNIVSGIGGLIGALSQLVQGNAQEAWETLKAIPGEIANNWQTNWSRIKDIWDESDESAKRSREQLSSYAQFLKDALKSIGTGGGFGGSFGNLEGIKKQEEAMKAYQGLLKELLTDEERTNEVIRNRLNILEQATISSEKYGEILHKILKQSVGEAPEFSGLDSSVLGISNELVKLQEYSDELDKWRETERERVLQFQSESEEDHQAYRDRLAEIDEEYNQKASELAKNRQLVERQIMQEQLGNAANLFGSMADIAKVFADEQSGVYKTMFAISKAFSIAESIMAINTAIAKASVAGPFPANLAAMATVASATAGLVGTIQSVQFSGMAHDGLDFIPQEGTWLLDRGERVVDARTNSDLKQYLDKQREERSAGMAPVVNLFEDKRRAGQVERGQDGSITAFVSDIRGGGPMSKALAATYGLKRRGA